MLRNHLVAEGSAPRWHLPRDGGPGLRQALHKHGQGLVGPVGPDSTRSKAGADAVKKKQQHEGHKAVSNGKQALSCPEEAVLLNRCERRLPPASGAVQGEDSFPHMQCFYKPGFLSGVKKEAPLT